MLARSRFAAALLMVVTAWSLGGEARANVTPLSSLIAGNGSIVVGNEVFDQFTYTGTGQMPAASNVNVASFTDAGGNVGIRITGGFTDGYDAGVQQASDAVITYRVTSLGGTLTGLNLAGDPLVVGGNGVMSVTETFQAGAAPPQQIDIHSTVNPAGSSLKLADSATFAPAQSIEVVNKGILGLNEGGYPTLSYIDQTFVQTAVPEPGSVVLLGLGAVGVLGHGWRRRRRRPATV